MNTLIACAALPTLCVGQWTAGHLVPQRYHLGRRRPAASHLKTIMSKTRRQESS